MIYFVQVHVQYTCKISERKLDGQLSETNEFTGICRRVTYICVYTI